MLNLAEPDVASFRPSTTGGVGLRHTRKALRLLRMIMTCIIALGASRCIAATAASPILERHLETDRQVAARHPRSEQDQAVVEGWPLYRTARGQEVFNQAMATLEVTAGPAPLEVRFRGCGNLACRLQLPSFSPTGWLPAGRLWLSPREFILIVHSPRLPSDGSYQRRSPRSMRVFVFHEFHNDTGNTDVFDTISSHSGSVFTPFYLSKPQRDAQGYGFVTLVQVAPYDVVSRHAANFGNRGPGIEVAKNRGDALSAIQAKAGIVLATMISHAVPHIRMVHHRGVEGLAMLRAYQQRRNSLSDRFVRLPFLSAPKHFLPLAGAQLSVLLDLAERKPMNLRSGLTPPSPQLISTGWHRSAVGSSSERWFLPAARQAYDPIGDLIRSLDEQRAAPPMPSGR